MTDTSEGHSVSKMRQLPPRTGVSTLSPAHHDTTSAAALTNVLIEAPAPDRLAYSIDEFCRAAGIGKSLGYGEIAAGRLKVVRVGRRTLVPVDSARAWLASLPEGVTGEPAAPRRARFARQQNPYADCEGVAQAGAATQPVRSAARSVNTNEARPQQSCIRSSRAASASS